MSKELCNKKQKDFCFCLFRIPQEGGRVLWEITNTCNYSCSYCIFSAENGIVPGELNTGEVFEVLEGLKARNFSHIKFSGGEPFVRQDLIQILEKTKELDFKVDVSTNASTITAEKARKIKECDVQMVHVSVDGHDLITHETVRGKNTYHRTVNGVRHLVANDLYVRIGTVIFKTNEDHLEKMVKSAIDLGVNEVIFSFMEPVGRMEGDDSLVSFRPIPEVKAELDQYARKYQDKILVNYSFTENVSKESKGVCPGGNKFLFIDNLGRVSPCTWVADKNPEFRSELTVKDVSFDEVMDSQPITAYYAYIKKLMKEGVIGCPKRRRS